MNRALSQVSLGIVALILALCLMACQEDMGEGPRPTPGPSYLTEEIPPCTPVAGSAVDPCKLDAEQYGITAGGTGPSPDFLGDRPRSMRKLLNYTRGAVSHIVLRGTYLPNTVRCTADNPYRPPSYLSYDEYDYIEHSLSINCYVDVQVGAYVLGNGPSTLTVQRYWYTYWEGELGSIAAEEGQTEQEYIEYLRQLLESDEYLGGIAGREVVLFLGPAASTSTEAWQVFAIWDVQRREDDTVVAVHPERDLWRHYRPDDYQTHRAALEMELSALTQAVTTAHQARVTEYGGRIGPETNLPMLVTNANQLRQYFTAVGAYNHPDGPPAQPPPPYPPTSVPTPTPTPVSTPTPTPTPASVPMPTPTPASTPTLTPTPMPTPTPAPGPAYLTEEIPPCTPVPGSSVDPCEPGAEGDLITESDGLIIFFEPPLLVKDLLNDIPIYTTHVVLRGTYLPGTVRCTSGHRNRFPSYVGDDWDVLIIYCFADVRVNAYLLGAGPSTLTVIVASSLYTYEGDDDEDYGLEMLESRRNAYERALTEGGRFEFDRPLRGDLPLGGPVVTGPPSGIEGREVVLFLGPSTSLSVEAWRVFETWDVERQEDDRVVALHPYRQWFNREERSYSEMELPALTQAVTAAHEARVAANGGRIGEDTSLPMLVTDANQLRQFFSDPKVGGYAPGSPTPALPPPPCGLAVPNQTDNPGLMRDCMTLLDAKDTLRGTATLDWSVDTSIGDWEGITTGDMPSRVTKLLLPNESLDGSIPPGLGTLFGLTHLDLSSNSLTGDIPAELGLLSNLQEIRLSGNSLTGCIPVALKDVATNDLSSLNLLYCRPPALENPSATATGDTGMVLTWDAVSNTSNYRVEYRIATATDWAVYDDVAVAAGVAVLLLNGPDRSTPVSATEACNLMDTPYDALLTSTTPFGETRAEIRYSGSDEHIVMTTTDHEGVLFGKGEMIIKDRTRYSRESTPGNTEVYGEWRVYGTNVPRSISLPCLDPGSFEQGASGSSDEPHFTSERFLSEEEGAVWNEYWADSTGRPTRARRTQFLPGYDGVSNTETIVVDFTYSGYGELNIIMSPCASAAPDQADNPALMRDCINLLGAKDTLRGTAALNWSLDTAITGWEGITTGGTPTRVTKLELPNEDLSGSIPAGLGNLVELTHLDLSSNSLTGDIPAELGLLSNLQEIRLSGNSLTGCIPVALKDVATNDLSSLNLLYCRPPAPENPSATATGDTGMVLTWDAVSNTSKYRQWSE